MADIVRSLLLVVAVLCLTVVDQKTAVGQDATKTEMPLDMMMGVPNPIGIHVVTHFIGDKKHGLTEELLRNAVELGLRRNNVPIAKPRSSYGPYLKLEIATLKITGLDTYVYSTSLDLYRFAWIGNWQVGAIMWSNGAIGYNSSEELLQAIRDTVLEIADGFSLEYLRGKELWDAWMNEASEDLRQELKALRESDR